MIFLTVFFLFVFVPMAMLMSVWMRQQQKRGVESRVRVREYYASLSALEAARRLIHTGSLEAGGGSWIPGFTHSLTWTTEDGTKVTATIEHEGY